MNIAIIGMGPFGLCVLETLLRHLRDDAIRSSLPGDEIQIHVIESNQAGAGAHPVELPDYMLLNTACGQLDLFGSRYFSGTKPSPMLSFMEWLRRENYTIDDKGLIELSGTGREIGPDDFLPRKLFGRYLKWVYQSLSSTRIAGVEILYHPTEALTIRQHLGAEHITTAQGEVVIADHVFLTTGHTANKPQQALARFLEPYPAAETLSAIQPGSEIAVAGIGLVAIDVITALTTGRRGYFKPGAHPGELHYQPSGLEPRIHLYSRNGLPFFCRPSSSLDTSGEYRPIIFSIDAIKKARAAGNGKLDFRGDVQPLLFAEMSILFYCRHIQLADGGTLEALAAPLADAWWKGRLEESLLPYRKRFGPFDPKSLLYGSTDPTFATSEEYQQSFCSFLNRDVQESIKGEEQSPFKAAIELLRVLRDTIRVAVEFDGLTHASRDDFNNVIAPMINRVVVGPPIQRGMELLALIKAGIVDVPFGPSPELQYSSDESGWHISSTSLQQPVSKKVESIVIGFLGSPTVDKSQSPLLLQLLEEGRIRPSKKSIKGAGIDVDPHAHPLNRHGTAEVNISVLGPLTEGSRYFTYYAPSPKSRFRAFLDADMAVSTLFKCYREQTRDNYNTITQGVS